jgi:hypothetical protein
MSVVFAGGIFTRRKIPASKQNPLELISALTRAGIPEVYINDANLKELVANLKEQRPKHVTVISVVGSARLGKSFLMNLIAKYLNHLESKSEGEWFTGEVNAHSVANFQSDKKYTAVTQGIWYSKPFMVDGNAFLLMDTQGLHDGDIDNEDVDKAIYAFSYLSSIKF